MQTVTHIGFPIWIPLIFPHSVYWERQTLWLCLVRNSSAGMQAHAAGRKSLSAGAFPFSAGAFPKFHGARGNAGAAFPLYAISLPA